MIANPQPPRMSAFEVSTDSGVLFYSKIDKKVLPNHPELVKTIQDYIANNKQSTNFNPSGQKSISKATTYLLYAAVFVIPLAIAAIYMNNNNKQKNHHEGTQTHEHHQRIQNIETINKLTL